MKPRLLEYIERYENKGIGWVPKYEREVLKDASDAYIGGWYRGMLDELLASISDLEIASIKHQLVKSGKDWEELYGNPKEGKE